MDGGKISYPGCVSKTVRYKRFILVGRLDGVVAGLYPIFPGGHFSGWEIFRDSRTLYTVGENPMYNILLAITMYIK